MILEYHVMIYNSIKNQTSLKSITLPGTDTQLSLNPYLLKQHCIPQGVR